LDNAGVQTVEIKEQDDAVVEAGLGLKDQTTTIFSLLASLAFSFSTFCFFGSCTTFVILVAKHRLFGLTRIKLLLVWTEELPAVELVHQEPFVPLGPRVLEGAEPEIARNRGQLFRQGNDLQVHHQLVNQIGICLGVVHELEDRLGVLVDSL